ncbi:MAG: hypothetical protein HQL02_00795 [Nitrospirae bacterium]|nr:hypothetical protein [Nitrospirota bacterium]
MKMLKNEDGFGLAMTMVFAVIALALTGGLLFVVMQESKLSGSTKRYSSAMEAARGGVSIAKDFIISGKITPSYAGMVMQNANCTNARISNATYDPDNTYLWGACDSYTDYNGVICTNVNPNYYATSADPKVCPDFILPPYSAANPLGLGDYTVYIKLADNKLIVTANTYSLITISVYVENPTLIKESVSMMFLYLLRIS